ncbi:MAG: chromosomal replication initiator protein DnaA [Chloroflexi bacterium]|nr:chromosomal replication initiator protein DnaA [Chloroflexota bacterium]
MINPAQKIWSACLGRLQLEIPRTSYDTWLKTTTGQSMEDGHLIVGVPTTFAAEWLERRLTPAIQRVASEVVGAEIRVVFQVTPGGVRVEEEPAVPLVSARASSPAADHTPPVAVAATLPRQEALNPRYSFSSFVVGEGNQLAYAAATAVAQQPGERYNPLFIYSGVGLGKTHLLHAIANEVALHSLRPMYVTSEQFTGDFVRSIRERTQDEFRARYRSADVLLVDDIQFLEGKEQTQIGFFHAFNELHNANRQIVIACDRAPSAVQFLEDRLRSRFQWGLVADIQPPDMETRTAILHQKAERVRVNLNQEVAHVIAQMPVTSIRELEGCLNKVIALATFLGKAITLDLVSTALPALANGTHRYALLTQEATLQAVAKQYATSVHDLCTRPRDRKTTEAQRVAMYLLATLVKVSAEETGRVLGDWNRRTVSNSFKAVQQKLQGDSAFKDTLDRLMEKL